LNLLFSAAAQAEPLGVGGFGAPTADAWSGAGWAIRLGVSVVLLLVSALVSGAEAAINELDVWRYGRLGERESEGNGALALFERDPQRFVSTLVIARTIVNVAIAAFITLSALQLGGDANVWRSALFGTLVASLMILVFGQIIPRAVVVPNAVRVSRLVIRPVYALSIALYPIGALFMWLTKQVLRLLRIEQGTGSHISEDELRQVLRDAEESGVIEAQERQMIRGVIDLEETVVREVMTPRVDVVAIATDATPRELLALVMEEGYSRLPVYAGSIDNVVGMVYARDLLKLQDGDIAKEGATVAELMTAVQFVPESLSVLNLLRDMRVRKSHIAVVVDEFGGTSGVVTLEDIIEEITGEIYDETDEEEEADILVLPSGGYRLLGSAHLESIGIALDIDFDEDGDYDTLAGFMIDELGHIPEVGAAVVHRGMRFEVEQADGRRIVSVLASPVTAGQTLDAAANAGVADVPGVQALSESQEAGSEAMTPEQGRRARAVQRAVDGA